MSLIDDAFEDFTVMNKSKVDDGYGGVTTTWTAGATIKGAVIYNTSEQAKIAQSLGSVETYKFVCRKDLQFDYHDVLRRDRDKKLFRIARDSDEYKTPVSAGLDLRAYFAEELASLPGDEVDGQTTGNS